MSALGAAAATGWLAAVLTLAHLLARRRAGLGRRERVVRALHELRGPLQVVALALHAIPRTGLPQARAAALEHELARVALALDDLRAAALGERPPADRSDVVAVDDLLAVAVAAWQPVAQARGAELRRTGPACRALVRGDRLRLAQACENLVANALEHGGGAVELSGRVGPDGVRIEVGDDGPGLRRPVADLARQARAGRGERGRGLAIAAAIAARHGGRLGAVASSSGVRVAIDLPAAGAEPSIRAEPA